MTPSYRSSEISCDGLFLRPKHLVFDFFGMKPSLCRRIMSPFYFLIVGRKKIFQHVVKMNRADGVSEAELCETLRQPLIN